MRIMFLNPDEILDKIELKNDMIAADFGCGSGGFTIPLAKRLNKGFVYAMDIQELPLNALKGKALAENILNIDFIRCDIEKKTSIAGASLDIATIINVFFQTEDKKALILEAKRVLKREGKLLVIDWNSSEYGPSGEKSSLNEIKEISREAGLEIEEEFSAGAYHSGILFKKV